MSASGLALVGYGALVSFFGWSHADNNFDPTLSDLDQEDTNIRCGPSWICGSGELFWLVLADDNFDPMP